MEQKGRKRKRCWYANDMLINMLEAPRTLGFLGPSGTSLRAFQGIHNLGKPGQVGVFVLWSLLFVLGGSGIEGS